MVDEVREAPDRPGQIFARDHRRVLSLADRCCLATAVRLDLPAVTDDRAWMTLDLGVKILPFR